MDLKVLLFITIGLVLIVADVWFVRTVYRAIKSTDVIIAPIKVNGVGPDSAAMGETLGRMLLARIREIEWQLEHAQTSLVEDEPSASGKDDTVDACSAQVESGSAQSVEIFGPVKTAKMNARLLEPTNIDLKVSGVDVGGLLPRLQAWLVKGMTLTLTVSFHEHSALAAGTLEAFGDVSARPLYLRVDNVTPLQMVDEIAYALVQRKFARNLAEVAALNAVEFKSLVNAVVESADINQRVRLFRIPYRADYETLVKQITSLANKMEQWPALASFAATVAETAQQYEQAIKYYGWVHDSGKMDCDKKIKELQNLVPAYATGREGIELAARYAVEVLSDLFGFKIDVPSVIIRRDDQTFAFWDGTSINAPPKVRFLPDLTYRYVAFTFLGKTWEYEFAGQSGALAVSYSDVLASFIKQTRLNQTAETADWVVAPGGVAWRLGRDPSDPNDNAPMSSLKAPGSAYDVPEVGKDPQVAHMRYYNSMIKFFVLDVLLRRVVAVSSDPAPDSAFAPSFFGRSSGQLP